MADLEIRPVRAGEVEAILDMLAPWQSREFFTRYFHGDPAFEPGHVCAAFDGGRPVSCAQVIPKTVRVVGGTATVAGIGQVWTEPAYRRRGIAPRVLRACEDVMRRERFALSLLFASRFDLYGALGWIQHPRMRSSVVAWPDGVPEWEIRAFDAAHDLPAVRDLYDVYAADVPGTTVRDAAAWAGSLRMAAYPAEEFLIAMENGAMAAYMRGTMEDGAYVAMEYAYRPGAYTAVAALLVAHARSAAADFVTIDLAHDRALHDRLTADGFHVNTFEDPFVMWRVLDRGALPARFHTDGAPADERALLQALLPPGSYTYWHADRF